MNKGRPREFSIPDALDKAVPVFWQKGYRGTSLDDLTDAMEINRPSLYAAFGDKENLFLSAVDRYREKYLVPAVRKLLEAKDLRKGLSEYFTTMADTLIQNQTPPGCLIACLLSEESCESEAIRNKLADSIGRADAAFYRLFEQHRKQLRKGLDSESAGKMMTSLMHGMATRARAGANKRTILQIGEAFIKLMVRDHN
jgi:AcrR family transcriptional regulator